MTAADKITSVRIILAPVFFVVFYFDKFFASVLAELVGYWRYWQVPALWIIFFIAQLSDMIDGMAARKRNETSDFGKFFDPFADTFIQITLFYCFVMSGILPMIPFLLILYREFAILFVRNLMQKKGISMGARIGGKIKTLSYIIVAILALLVFSFRFLSPLFVFFGLSVIHERLITFFSAAAPMGFWLALILSLVSFIDYVIVYRKSVGVK